MSTAATSAPIYGANTYHGARRWSAILRHENIDAERSNRLTGVTGSTSLSKTLPGIGATWNLNKDLTVFASLHKGFAAPRVEDLIGAAVVRAGQPVW